MDWLSPQLGTAVSPIALLDSCLDRQAALDGVLNAICTPLPEIARAAARDSAARQCAEQSLSPLDGVPFTVKDNLFVGGVRATWGSRLFADFMPAEDDLCVARMRAAGAVLTGKTNTPEFAMAPHTGNTLFGITRNPWDTTRVPAGSSGGAAVAVATGMAPLALGTDAGGSIRLPAAFTGITGFRPTVGRIPRLHGFPPVSVDFQAIGLLARGVAEVRLMLDVVEGADPRDRASLGLPEGAMPLAGLRVRLVRDPPGGRTLPEIAALVADAGRVLTGLGCTVTEGPMPHDATALATFSAVLSAAGIARIVTPHTDWRDRVTPPMREIAERGLTLSAAQHVAALDALAAWRAATAAGMAGIDLLLTPTCPVAAWPIDTGPPASVAGEPAGPRMPVAFTAPANAMGWPAISLPCGLTAEGLPVGAQLIGGFGQDATVLAVAEAFQAATRWHMMQPPITTLDPTGA